MCANLRSKYYKGHSSKLRVIADHCIVYNMKYCSGCKEDGRMAMDVLDEEVKQWPESFSKIWLAYGGM